MRKILNRVMKERSDGSQRSNELSAMAIKVQNDEIDKEFITNFIYLNGKPNICIAQFWNRWIKCVVINA